MLFSLCVFFVVECLQFTHISVVPTGQWKLLVGPGSSHSLTVFCIFHLEEAGTDAHPDWLTNALQIQHGSDPNTRQIQPKFDLNLADWSPIFLRQREMYWQKICTFCAFEAHARHKCCLTRRNVFEHINATWISQLTLYFVLYSL